MVLLALMWGLLILSLCYWQRDIIAYQILWQILLAGILLLMAYQSLRKAAGILPFAVAFDQQGEWIYLDQAQHAQWQITNKSRLCNWLVWLELALVSDPAQRHWLVIFCDQLDDQHYRRLCRAVLCQQHTREQ